MGYLPEVFARGLQWDARCLQLIEEDRLTSCRRDTTTKKICTNGHIKFLDMGFYPIFDNNPLLIKNFRGDRLAYM